MKGEIYLKKPADFTRIHKQGGYLGSRLVSVKSLPNSLLYSRWAIITSKKLGKAVIRNRVKRRLREIMREISLKPGEDMIIIARTAAVAADYQKLKEETRSLLKRAGMVKVDEINSPAAN